jgi:MFS family permease
MTNRGAASGLYLAGYFSGGLVGSAVLGQIFDRFGWPACVLGIGLALAVSVVLATQIRSETAMAGRPCLLLRFGSEVPWRSVSWDVCFIRLRAQKQTDSPAVGCDCKKSTVIAAGSVRSIARSCLTLSRRHIGLLSVRLTECSMRIGCMRRFLDVADVGSAHASADAGSRLSSSLKRSSTRLVGDPCFDSR